MAKNLQPYQAMLRVAEAEFRGKLASGKTTADSIALYRRSWEIMTRELTASPDSVLVYDTLPPDPKTGYRGPERWRLSALQKAAEEISPQTASDAGAEAYRRKYEEYLDLGVQIVQSPDMRQRCVIDRQNGKSYLYQENPVVPRIMRIVATELMIWFESRPATPAFLRQSARAGLADFLAERPDMVALLRLAQTLPKDTEISDVPVERPAMVEAVELAIGLIPVVGSLVASYEAYTGKDLFGYALSDLERGVLAAAVLLPLAGRVVKYGRVVYTESRLVQLYGRDAQAWSRVTAAGGRVTENATARRAASEAEALVRVDRDLGAALAKETAAAIPALVRGPVAASSAVDQAIGELFRELSQQHRILQSLDDLALRRILEKGPNVDHLKGQLLEELIESRVVPWLRDRTGSYALGIASAGKRLEFIPGHLVRDVSGRQISDGLLVIRNQGVLEIAAVFEAKAGKRAARELSLASGSMSLLTQEERAELRAFAKDELREQRDAARQSGKAFAKTLADVEKEIALAERGGQVRRDIERLSENADGSAATIIVGSETVPIRFSPTRTKFFGIMPKDVNPALMEKELKEAGFAFELIGVDIDASSLKSVAEKLKPLAAKMAEAP